MHRFTPWTDITFILGKEINEFAYIYIIYNLITELFVVFEVFSQYRPKIGLDSTEEKKWRKLTTVIYKSTCIDTYKETQHNVWG